MVMAAADECLHLCLPVVTVSKWMCCCHSCHGQPAVRPTCPAASLRKNQAAMKLLHSQPHLVNAIMELHARVSSRDMSAAVQEQQLRP
jgi:hypothetical protein